MSPHVGARGAPGLHAAPIASAARSDAVLDALATAGEPGTFTYANVNYMLAGTVAEQLGGAVWKQLIAARVFEPLDMDCGFGAPTGPDAPLGCTADGTVIGDDDPITVNPAALGASGAVNCAMADWSTFAAAVLDGLHGEDTVVLTGATVADCRLWASPRSGETRPSATSIVRCVPHHAYPPNE